MVIGGEIIVVGFVWFVGGIVELEGIGFVFIGYVVVGWDYFWYFLGVEIVIEKFCFNVWIYYWVDLCVVFEVCGVGVCWNWEKVVIVGVYVNCL